MSQPTAEAVYRAFRRLSVDERARFYTLLAEPNLANESLTHQQVFGHLAGEEFTSQEAADYLDVSIATFRRYVKAGRISPSSEMGKNHLYAAGDLKAFKRSLHTVKGR
jgi:DNA-directed RNA polymerase specialized sigma24 family protein